MSVETLLESIPAYAKDIKLNLSSVLKQTELTPQQLWGTALACAIASRNTAVLECDFGRLARAYFRAGRRRRSDRGGHHVDE